MENATKHTFSNFRYSKIVNLLFFNYLLYNKIDGVAMSSVLDSLWVLFVRPLQLHFYTIIKRMIGWTTAQSILNL